MRKIIVLVKKISTLSVDLEDDSRVEEFVLKAGFCMALAGLVVCVVILWFSY